MAVERGGNSVAAWRTCRLCLDPSGLFARTSGGRGNSVAALRVCRLWLASSRRLEQTSKGRGESKPGKLGFSFYKLCTTTECQHSLRAVEWVAIAPSPQKNQVNLF